jgi:hypothetical protein
MFVFAATMVTPRVCGVVVRPNVLTGAIVGVTTARDKDNGVGVKAIDVPPPPAVPPPKSSITIVLSVPEDS